MAGFDFLQGVTVVEVAQLGPSALGGYLADMGADVIKVEGAQGDPIRRSGAEGAGSPDGYGYQHLRWNRGKRSVVIDLKSARGIELFRDLVAGADVVYEGMRAGVLERLGVGYDVLRAEHPSLVFCSLSGYGLTGPYSAMGSSGPSYDAFGGMGAFSPYSHDHDAAEFESRVIGMHAVSLYAAMGVIAAIAKARLTGVGSLVEVSAAEAAAHWTPASLDRVLNEGVNHQRPGFNGESGKMLGWPLLNEYTASDGRRIFFQGRYPRFWGKFCELVDRADLLAIADAGDDDRLFAELTELFASRTAAAWMEFFLVNDIAGSPVNTLRDLAVDPHFVARDNVYEV
ncbi:MAG TPA: CoA transferase, partial [Ilumatobacteraceae bacterium]|nr:CoA transferase [Ilumatobacteraceae bacterium]